ncbi:unconventional prefoldin RPB5 interactor 1-like isoform X3 [Acropora millepora]|uniref:unconventional prefoldin RPB5 interactor 1-like isoform X3 n=1 Tax=Acropora millepora TaxID=45264 RepID=UPI0010FCD8C3|nr:unconventional prefoldin RPB5 interactor 1-like isoform X3 [Acropora millepora]
MAEFAHISRFQEENRKALLERQQRLNTCEKYKQDYEKLEELLKTLPNRTTHEVMVPIGSVAFMPGKLVHTNEITVLLGDNWFAERSASQALKIVERRKKYLEDNIAGINKDIKSFDARLKFAADIQSVAEENSEVKEIKENLSQQDEERLLNKGARKAHPKAERFGGSKKVKGLKHIEKETVGVQSKTAAAVSSEELSLLARLDELEKKETANAELHHWDDFDNDNKNSVQYSSKDDDVIQEKSSVAQDKEIGGLIRKVKWNDFDGAKDSGSNSGDSDDYGEEGNGEVKTTIAVKFSTSPRSILQKSEDQRLNQHSVITPADIYSQFTSKQELKSILKRPSIEGKDEGNLRDKLSPSTQDSADKKDSEAKIHKDEFDFQKAFTGNIVEKTTANHCQQNTSAQQVSTTEAGKKPSRFKAARQKHL